MSNREEQELAHLAVAAKYIAVTELLWPIETGVYVESVKWAGTFRPFLRLPAIDRSARLCRRIDVGLGPGQQCFLGRLYGLSGPAAGNYTSSIDVGNTTTYAVSSLPKEAPRLCRGGSQGLK